jgi:hypothetical protein
MLERGVTKCPTDKADLHWYQAHGMRLIKEVVPKKPKRPFFVYTAFCPKCNTEYQIKK